MIMTTIKISTIAFIIIICIITFYYYPLILIVVVVMCAGSQAHVVSLNPSLRDMAKFILVISMVGHRMKMYLTVCTKR